MTTITSDIETLVVDHAWANRALNSQMTNRKLNARRVKALAADMLAGRWIDGASMICFDDQGHLIDGQHRLSAVVVSDTPQLFHVMTGLTRYAQVVIDTGRSRTAADQLSMTGSKN